VHDAERLRHACVRDAHVGDARARVAHRGRRGVRAHADVTPLATARSIDPPYVWESPRSQRELVWPSNTVQPFCHPVVADTQSSGSRSPKRPPRMICEWAPVSGIATRVVNSASLNRRTSAPDGLPASNGGR
jgi:hypothetical protein